MVDILHAGAKGLTFFFALRQAVYLCLTCPEARGLCAACSIACHTDHEQIELCVTTFKSYFYFIPMQFLCT